MTLPGNSACYACSILSRDIPVISCYGGERGRESGKVYSVTAGVEEFVVSAGREAVKSDKNVGSGVRKRSSGHASLGCPRQRKVFVSDSLRDVNLVMELQALLRS